MSGLVWVSAYGNQRRPSQLTKRSGWRQSNHLEKLCAISIRGGFGRKARAISRRRGPRAPARAQFRFELKQLRAELGNDLAFKAYRDGTLPFPDRAIIAALHWNEDSSDSDNQALAAGFPGVGLESTFAGSAVNAQFMVKESKKYAASGG